MLVCCIVSLVSVHIVDSETTLTKSKPVEKQKQPAQVEHRAPVRLAVEFNAHAACAHVARSQGWFEKAGITVSSYNSYMTGVALAAALARGDVDAAYVCLIPALNVKVNGGVPIKVVAGTHKYGYGLAVNPDRVNTMADLAKPDIRIGCCREGSAVDALLHKMIEAYTFDEEDILSRTVRMNPTDQLLALTMNRIDAALMGEQYPTMAESLGYCVLISAEDLWPDMQGSVLVVTDDFIKKSPEVVSKMVAITEQATTWIRANPEETARIVATELSAVGETVFPADIARRAGQLTISPDAVYRCLTKRMMCSTHLDKEEIQRTIQYLLAIGNLRTTCAASDIVDLRWLAQEDSGE